MDRVAAQACSEPLVTAVVTTRDRADLLPRAIDSVLAQTYPCIEVIVVDDGSHDRTRRVVDGYQSNPRVKYLRHATSRGGSAARNTGIGHAGGNYVAFLDDDDTWEPDKTVRQLAVHADCELSICGARRTSNGRVDIRFASHKVGAAELRRGFIFAGGASNIMVETAVARRLLFDETLPCGQDWDFVLRAALGWRVAYLAEPLVRYNDAVHPRITNRPLGLDRLGLEQRMRVANKHAEFLGPYWTAFHRADRLLSHVAQRSERLAHLRSALAECGWIPTAGVLARKFRRGLRRRLAGLRPA
jgi:glycosyltransferase involved in cell wall biosynthesis